MYYIKKMWMVVFMSAEQNVQNSFLTASEIAKVLQCSTARGYKTVRELNEELEAQGYKTMKGRTNRIFFEQRFGIGGIKK